MAGRRAKPSAVKELAGNPGHRSINKDEPKPKAAGIPPPPTWMGVYGKAQWKRLAVALDRLNLLGEIDLLAFEGLCGAYDTWRAAAAHVKKHKSTYTEGKIIRLNPMVRVRDHALKELRQYAAEFGLTPAARSRVAAVLTSGDQPPLPGAEGWPAEEDPNREMPDAEFTDDEMFNPGRVH